MPTPASPCLSCQVANGDVTPPGGDVVRTANFNVSQDVHYKIPGFMIVASNRHFKGFDAMTEDEAREFALLVRRVRRAQRTTLAIEDVYYFYNEDTRHHFHVWMIPRLDWMARFGRSLESVAPALEWAHANLNGEGVHEAAAKLRSALETTES